MKFHNAKLALVGLTVIGLCVAGMPYTTAKADIELMESTKSFIAEVDAEMISEGLVDQTEIYEIDYTAPKGLAIAIVDSKLNIRKGPGTNYGKVGYLSKNGACIILEKAEGNWVQIKSGDITGYVDSSYLITEDEAAEFSKACISLRATVTADALNVRSKPTTQGEKITSIKKGTTYKVLLDEVAGLNGDGTWVKIQIDDSSVGYVSSEWVTLGFDLEWAHKFSPYGDDISELRISICDYAKKFIGTRYVWGGNSLTSGIDCSGFVKYVFKANGITTSRNSRSLASECKKISVSELKAGDLVFYGNLNTKYIDHVAIYFGNGQIIHSSTNYNGVAVSSMYFSKSNSYGLISCGRIIND